MSAEQDKLLTVIEDEGSAAILADFWQKVQNSPLQAARVIRALEQSAVAIKKVTEDIPQAWKTLDEQTVESDARRLQFMEDLRVFRRDTAAELSALAETMSGLQKALAGVNENQLLNKANRIIEAAEKLRKLKDDGSLELLKKLL